MQGHIIGLPMHAHMTLKRSFTFEPRYYNYNSSQYIWPKKEIINCKCNIMNEKKKFGFQQPRIRMCVQKQNKNKTKQQQQQQQQ